MTQGCHHVWMHGGLRYRAADYPRSGTSARDRIYWDWFYCTLCLADQYKNERVIGSTYEEVIPGSVPR